MKDKTIYEIVYGLSRQSIFFGLEHAYRQRDRPTSYFTYVDNGKEHDIFVQIVGVGYTEEEDVLSIKVIDRSKREYRIRYNYFTKTGTITPLS